MRGTEMGKKNKLGRVARSSVSNGGEVAAQMLAKAKAALNSLSPEELSGDCAGNVASNGQGISTPQERVDGTGEMTIHDQGVQGQLSDIIKRANELKLLRDKLESRNVDLERRESSLIQRSDNLKEREQVINRREEEVRRRESELKSNESRLVEWEARLDVMEIEANNGFPSRMNDLRERVVSEIKRLQERAELEIQELETRKEDIRQEINELRRQEDEAQVSRRRALVERESEVKARNADLEAREHQLEVNCRDFERMRQKAVEEGRSEERGEVDRLKGVILRRDERIDDLSSRLLRAEESFDQFLELSAVLGEREPMEVLDDLKHCQRRIRELEARALYDEEAELRQENENLRRSCEILRERNRKSESELEGIKVQLHKYRLGVSDKEMLEREKTALETKIRVLSRQWDELAKKVDDLTEAQEADIPFPQMTWMDNATSDSWIQDRDAHELKITLQGVTDLAHFCSELQHRIAVSEKGTKLYFDIHDVRLLVSGLSMSQLHIFQGMSGTGKTSLAKAFAKAVGGFCTDISVQAGWRDRDDLIGHYNAFEKRFYEKDCLQGLYRAQTDPYSDRCNVILLDEMNLSRPEQYFAEFLSAIEKNDPLDRLISLSESRLPHAPRMLVEGRRIRVPRNVWFIGTANHDETTNEFADKTYDRAHVMTLPRHDGTFAIRTLDPTGYSFGSLVERFDDARSKHELEVKELLEELTTGPLGSVLQERFQLGWGNRFERQALRFISVFIASGGNREDALDHLLASRVLRRGKVVGRYDIMVEDLKAVKQALDHTWTAWQKDPRHSAGILEEDIRRKERGG